MKSNRIYTCPYCNIKKERAYSLKNHFCKFHRVLKFSNIKACNILNNKKLNITNEELLIAALSYQPSTHTRINKNHREKAFKIIRYFCEINN